MNKLLPTLILILICSISLGQSSDAPTTDYNNISMPESPSAAAFNAVGNTSVNTATGIPTISIPLYTYEVDGVKVPIAISYDASGVKVGAMSGPVGLNWNLEAGGQISRTVRNKTDEYEGWLDSDYSFIPDEIFDDYEPTSPYNWQQDMSGTYINDFEDGYAKNRDHNPDLFSYRFLSNQGTYIHDPAGVVIKAKTDGVAISSMFDNTNNNYDVELNAQDLMGNEYLFNLKDTETSSNKNIYNNGSGLEEDFYEWEGANGNPITAWKLSELKTKNNKRVHFEYQTDTMSYTYSRDVENRIILGATCDTQHSVIREKKGTKTTYNYNTRLINKIWSPDSSIEVNFYYQTDTGLADTVWKTKLTHIIIKDTISGHEKRFEFTYERFGSGGDPRLKLKSVYELATTSSGTVQKPPYTFTYEGNFMPPKDSYGQDFFGYYNNESSNSSLVPYEPYGTMQDQGFFSQHAGDRSLSIGHVDNGILTQIDYPTGGRTEFTYEPNAIGSKYLGGLRIGEIEDTDETGTYHRKVYNYSNLNGFDYDGHKSFWRKNEEETTTYYSSFVATPGGPAGYKPGYFYGNVTIISHSGSDNYKEVHIYEDNTYANHAFDYALKESSYYKGTQKVKTVEYINELIGTVHQEQWNILGNMMCYGTSPNSMKQGHSDEPKIVRFNGNYSYAPTKIATTEFLKQGVSLKPVTAVREVTYDPTTMLITQEINDASRTRVGFDNYSVTNSNADILTTDYEYPWHYTELDALELPKSLPISKVVTSDRLDDVVQGQFFEYDTNGNIKTTYAYNKGAGTNTSTYNYIPSNYEEMTSFEFLDGKPVEMVKKHGSPTSYIWGYDNQYPVAKIEGRARAGLNGTLVSAIENATATSMEGALDNLRNHTSIGAGMMTSYTHKPLAGVKTIVDPKGDKITYYYDDFGRLSYIKDKDGNRITENTYIYGN